MSLTQDHGWQSPENDPLTEISDLLAFVDALERGRSYTPRQLLMLTDSRHVNETIVEVLEYVTGIRGPIPVSAVVQVLAKEIDADITIVRQWREQGFPFGRMRICLRRRLLEMACEVGQ